MSVKGHNQILKNLNLNTFYKFYTYRYQLIRGLYKASLHGVHGLLFELGKSYNLIGTFKPFN